VWSATIPGITPTSGAGGYMFRMSRENWIEKCSTIHKNKFDYSLFPEIVSARTMVTIICPIHGEFIQNLDSHSRGIGCKKCSKNDTKNREQIIKECNDKFGVGTYDYSLLPFGNITASTKVSIICPKHGIWKTEIASHRKGHGCKRCKESKGESKISNILQKYNIYFIREYWFPDCRNIQPLRFDFFLPDINILIEYQGSQHYIGWKNTKSKHGTLREIQKRDEIKRKYCLTNNIKLLEITYLENIEDKMMEIITTYLPSAAGECRPAW